MFLLSAIWIRTSPTFLSHSRSWLGGLSWFRVAAHSFMSCTMVNFSCFSNRQSQSKALRFGSKADRKVMCSWRLPKNPSTFICLWLLDVASEFFTSLLLDGISQSTSSQRTPLKHLRTKGCSVKGAGWKESSCTTSLSLRSQSLENCSRRVSRRCTIWLEIPSIVDTPSISIWQRLLPWNLSFVFLKWTKFNT